MAELVVGQTIELSDSRIAVVRYVGQAHFAPGDWVGVELHDETGKNDGSVQGERYFTCKMGRGMFVRPGAVTLLESHPRPERTAGTTVQPTKRLSRTSSVVSGQGRTTSTITDPTSQKRLSMNTASPSPAARVAGRQSILRSPTKSPTKLIGSSATSVSSTPRTGTPPTRPPSTSTAKPSVTSAKPRQGMLNVRSSMGPPAAPASRTSRQSLTGSNTTSTRLSSISGRTLVARTSSASTSHLRAVSQNIRSGVIQKGETKVSDGEVQEAAQEDDSRLPDEAGRDAVLSPNPVSPVMSRVAAVERQITSPTALSTRTVSSATVSRTTGSTPAAGREIEELKAKLALMEKKRMEDREKLKSLDRIQGERDRFENIIQKLQAKYQPQQQEISELRKQLKESNAKFEDLEKTQAEHDLAVEMATLDREMAEETAEVLKTELEALKLKTEELELEVDVLREENSELTGEMSPEEKASQGWLQMERTNERLREALIRLRDLTQQQECELREEIASLEEDVRELSSVKEEYEAAKQRLAQAEARIEDLCQQLDGALGAEDMIEELTEKNMSLAEQIEELKTAIEDLEALKELNDELEINHIEAEKELQEDIDFKDSVIAEQAKHAAQKEATIEDMEYTLSKFRELVINLQSDLEDMRASHALTEAESEQLNERSRAMMDLNMKLQVSAAKTQVKAIDLELKRLDSEVAIEHLAIVQFFLPEAYLSDGDSVMAYLRFKRVGFKANMLHGFIKERVSDGHHRADEDVFAACDVAHKLAWLSSMCARFVNAISHCSTIQFANYESARYELEPVERALNGWIEGLRRDDIKTKQCDEQLQRTIAVMSHLGEVHLTSSLEGHAEDIHMKSLVIQSHLETTATALSLAKNMVQSIVPKDEENEEEANHFSRKADGVIDYVRSAKVIAAKVVRSLEELKYRSLSLPLDTFENFERCEASVQQLGSFARQVGEDLYDVLHEEGRTDPFTYQEVRRTIQRASDRVFLSSELETFSSFSDKLRTATNLITDLAALASDLDCTQEFERAPAPWVVRAQEISSSRVLPVDAEEEIRHLKENNQERARIIAMRDQSLEEASVKIELLESRMREATKKTERISGLENRIEEARKKERELTNTLSSQTKEFASLESDRDRWKKIAGEAKAAEVISPATNPGQERAVATALEMQALKSEISNLQAAVRYLREDNCRIRYEPRNLQWLGMPLVRNKSLEDQRRELVIAEGYDVLNELLNLATSCKIYDLSTLPKNHAAWQPAKSTPQYHVAKQREDYAVWRSWTDTVAKKAAAVTPQPQVKSKTERQRRVAAQIKLDLPHVEAKGLKAGGEVEIVQPDDFDAFREMLGPYSV